MATDYNSPTKEQFLKASLQERLNYHDKCGNYSNVHTDVPDHNESFLKKKNEAFEGALSEGQYNDSSDNESHDDEESMSSRDEEYFGRNFKYCTGTKVNRYKNFGEYIVQNLVFDIGFRIVGDSPNIFNSKTCKCPCSGAFEPVLKCFGIHKSYFKHDEYCSNNSFSPEGLRDHLQTHIDNDCKFHELTYKYLQILYFNYLGDYSQEHFAFETGFLEKKKKKAMHVRTVDTLEGVLSYPGICISNGLRNRMNELKLKKSNKDTLNQPHSVNQHSSSSFLETITASNVSRKSTSKDTSPKNSTTSNRTDSYIAPQKKDKDVIELREDRTSSLGRNVSGDNKLNNRKAGGHVVHQSRRPNNEHYEKCNQMRNLNWTPPTPSTNYNIRDCNQYNSYDNFRRPQYSRPNWNQHNNHRFNMDRHDNHHFNMDRYCNPQNRNNYSGQMRNNPYDHQSYSGLGQNNTSDNRSRYSHSIVKHDSMYYPKSEQQHQCMDKTVDEDKSRSTNNNSHQSTLSTNANLSTTKRSHAIELKRNINYGRSEDGREIYYEALKDGLMSITEIDSRNVLTINGRKFLNIDTKEEFSSKHANNDETKRQNSSSPISSITMRSSSTSSGKRKFDEQSSLLNNSNRLKKKGRSPSTYTENQQNESVKKTSSKDLAVTKNKSTVYKSRNFERKLTSKFKNKFINEEQIPKNLKGSEVKFSFLDSKKKENGEHVKYVHCTVTRCFPTDVDVKSLHKMKEEEIKALVANTPADKVKWHVCIPKLGNLKVIMTTAMLRDIVTKNADGSIAQIDLDSLKTVNEKCSSVQKNNYKSESHSYSLSSLNDDINDYNSCKRGIIFSNDSFKLKPRVAIVLKKNNCAHSIEVCIKKGQTDFGYSR